MFSQLLQIKDQTLKHHVTTLTDRLIEKCGILLESLFAAVTSSSGGRLEVIWALVKALEAVSFGTCENS